MRQRKKIRTITVIFRWFLYYYLPRAIEKIGIDRQLGFIEKDLTYCLRCDACGIDECCGAEICDNGFLCANLYGTLPQRLKIIRERDE